MPTRTGAVPKKSGLLDRLAIGPVICAEGYLFEFERRGYLQAGAYVPEIVLERPDLVESLHREFVHAGSDVVEAFTYYAHRAKLRMIGREGDLAKINRTALRIAKKVARSTGTLLAGDICNTSIYDPHDAKAQKQARRLFDEQIDWAVEAGVDFIVAETYAFGAEALLALEAIRQGGKPSVVTLAIPRHGTTRAGSRPTCPSTSCSDPTSGSGSGISSTAGRRTARPARPPGSRARWSGRRGRRSSSSAVASPGSAPDGGWPDPGWTCSCSRRASWAGKLPGAMAAAPPTSTVPLVSKSSASGPRWTSSLAIPRSTSPIGSASP